MIQGSAPTAGLARVRLCLSVIDIRQYAVATEAGHMVARLIRGELVESEQVLLAPLLEENGSCAPLPSLER